MFEEGEVRVVLDGTDAGVSGSSVSDDETLSGCGCIHVVLVVERKKWEDSNLLVLYCRVWKDGMGKKNDSQKVG